MKLVCGLLLGYLGVAMAAYGNDYTPKAYCIVMTGVACVLLCGMFIGLEVADDCGNCPNSSTDSE